MSERLNTAFGEHLRGLRHGRRLAGAVSQAMHSRKLEVMARSGIWCTVVDMPGTTMSML